MNYENWTNGNITTYNNKRVNSQIIKNLTKKVCKVFNKKKTFSNKEYVKLGMSLGLAKELNKMN
ncbi:MAG: hypothetical protein ACOC3Z_00585 [Nanoarchaeota archaeon]